jgi:hypothetical protein
MSRLIRGDENASQQDSTPMVLLPLSPSAVVTHLKSCQELAKDHLNKSFVMFLKTLVDAYDIEIDRAASNAVSSEILAVQHAVRKKGKDLQHYFTGYFLEGFVKFNKRKLNTSIGDDDDVLQDLSIVDNDVLEESIAISSITQRADTYFAEPIWALNQRFGVLANGEPVTEASNPISPIQYCDALRRSLKLIEFTPRTKITAYKVFDLQLLNLFRFVSEDVNRYLKSQGILPNIRFSLPKSEAPKSSLLEEGDSLGRREADYGLQQREAGNDETQSQSELISAIRNLHQQIAVNQHVSSQPSGPVVNADELVGVLSGLQKGRATAVNLQQTSAAALSPVDISAFVQQLKAELEEKSDAHDVEKNDMQTIDLVGLVFEYMLDDENIPDSIKAVLSYLHTPFLKIAFIDPHFFERSEHPARVLLNSLADAGARWVANDGTSQFDVYNKIKGVVDRVLKEFDKDVKTITSLLFEFNSYVKKISHKQELTEQRAKEKAEGEDKLREMKIKVNEVVRERIRGKELPSAVLLLLLQPWSDYLTLMLLRHGDSSEKWQAGVSLVDDVLWCIEPKETDEEKTALQSKLSTILKDITDGFSEVGFESSKGSKLLHAFSSMCALAENAKPVEPAPQPMRNELERRAAKKAGQNIVEQGDITQEEAQIVENLKLIEFGTWFEFEGGKRLKIAWYNGRTSHYMLVDQIGKRVGMESGLSLAKKMIAGKAKIISGSTKPFFERALENIYHKLNEQAEASQPEDQVTEHD